MFSAERVKKALGKKRWEKVEDYSFDCGVIDVMFKVPWINLDYNQTIYVYEPDGWSDPYSFASVIEDLKQFIDGMVYDWRLCLDSGNFNSDEFPEEYKTMTHLEIEEIEKGKIK